MGMITGRICCGSITGCDINDSRGGAEELFHFKFQIAWSGEGGGWVGLEVYLEGAVEVVAGEVFEFPIDAHAEGGGGPVFWGGLSPKPENLNPTP